MHERSISIGEGAAGDETATDAPFSVTSVLEVDGQPVVRVRGTALGIVEPIFTYGNAAGRTIHG